MAAVPPPPPNIHSYKGNDAGLVRALLEWVWAFYRATVLESFFVSNAEFLASNQATLDLIDPAAATAATAQATANAALTLASLGIIQVELPESPVVSDDTVSEYIFDVSDYDQVEMTLDGIGFASADEPRIEVSVDGGVTYKTGASDYRGISVSSAAEASADAASFPIGDGSGTTDLNGTASFKNLNVGRLSYHAVVGLASSAIRHGGFANFDGPVSHIKIIALGSFNFDAGTIRVVGIR